MGQHRPTYRRARPALEGVPCVVQWNSGTGGRRVQLHQAGGAGTPSGDPAGSPRGRLDPPVLNRAPSPSSSSPLLPTCTIWGPGGGVRIPSVWAGAGPSTKLTRKNFSEGTPSDLRKRDRRKKVSA